MSTWILPFALLVLGLVLLVAEDLLPTGGALGLLAVACLLIVLYHGFVDSIEQGSRYLVAELVMVPAGYGALGVLIRRSALGRSASLRPPEPEETGVAHASGDLDRLVARSALALTPLRPSGMVELEGRRLEAVAEEGLIAAGSAVRVVRVRSGRLVVRPDGDAPGPGLA